MISLGLLQCLFDVNLLGRSKRLDPSRWGRLRALKPSVLFPCERGYYLGVRVPRFAEATGVALASSSALGLQPNSLFGVGVLRLPLLPPKGTSSIIPHTLY